MYSNTTIENAIVAALDVSPINTYAKTIEPYAGQLEQEIGKSLLLMPAVLPVFAGDAYSEANGQNTQYNQTCDWDVICAVRNLRGDVAALQGAGSGATAEVGINQMLDDVRAALTGNNLSLQIEPLRIMHRRRILASRAAFIYAVRFQTQLDYVA